MTELKVGDLFTPSLQIRGRQAFRVTKVLEKSIKCRERSTPDSTAGITIPDTSKPIKGYVYLLKREGEK